MRNDSLIKQTVLLAALGLCTCVFPSGLPGRSLEHLSPPSLSRGKTNRLTLLATELGGATGLWTSLPPKAVEATLIESSGTTRPSSR